MRRRQTQSPCTPHYPPHGCNHYHHHTRRKNLHQETESWNIILERGRNAHGRQQRWQRSEMPTRGGQEKELTVLAAISKKFYEFFVQLILIVAGVLTALAVDNYR